MKWILLAVLVLIFTGAAYSEQHIDVLTYNFVGETEIEREIETAHFIIRSQEGNEIFAQEMAEFAESIYEDTTTFMRCTPDRKVKVTLFPNHRTFAFVGFAGEGAVLYYGSPFSTESGGTYYFDRKRQIAHEFTHCLLFERVEAFKDPAVTMKYVWMSEGVAMYASDSGYNLLRSKAALGHLVKTDDIPRLKDVYGHPFAGFLSYSVISYIIDRHGEGDFHLFLDELSPLDTEHFSEENVDRAFQNAFGMPMDDFEEEWLLYVHEFAASEEDEEKEFATTILRDEEGKGTIMASSWHDDNILFVSSVDRDLNIYVMNKDGTAKRLTSSLSADYDPRFSPDGTRIVFTSRRDGYANIYCMDRDGSNVVQLTFGKSIDSVGSWSPDGETIAFTSSRSGNYDIYVMDSDGSDVVQLTDDPGNDGWPVFSPDGKKIVFVSDRNGSYDLYCMDGEVITQLTDTPEYENYPQYSPDGKRIAFVSKNERGSKICIIKSDGGDREVLVPQQWIVDGTMMVSYGIPVWSDTGDKIAFMCGTQILCVDVPGDGYYPFVVLVLAGLIMAAALILKEQRERTNKD